MARPVNANAEATRRRILDGAAQLFSEQGAGQTSVRRIAREAGVSLAMIHHYFGSKDELYTACIQSMFDELRSFGDIIDAVVRDAPNLGLLPSAERLVRQGFQFAIAHQAAVRLLMRSILDEGTIGHRWRQEHIRNLERFSKLTAALLGRQPQAVRLHLWSVVNLMVRYTLTSPDELSTAGGLADGLSTEEIYTYYEDHLVELAGLCLQLPFEAKAG